MDDSYTNFPTSHLVGSVPAVVTEEKNSYKPQAPAANSPILPPNNGPNAGRGYQTLGEGDGQQSTNRWNGVFSVSSYTEYFNVDTDLVLNRLMSSLNPTTGDFFSKIDANPDLYGLVWISTTLVFVLSSIGNCATYLMQSDSNSSWNFDVNYVNVAACSVYGYALLVPLGFYFLIRYMGTSASLIRFWCLWGYSLFVLVLSSFLLIIPVEFLRWTITIAAATTSASFVALNLRTYVQSDDLMIILVASFALQAALTIFIKMWFFS
ncbi:protein YIPF1 homolog isoform X2 [Solanum pennellii]|uniref:Protein YIP n=1 Tax=Solanum pennellii TaxID=28526 RepID=A0ABM1GRC4_SOLPN|nr:protein YIPF1 homolog isoform X2 [Solanum pennellii]